MTARRIFPFRFPLAAAALALLVAGPAARAADAHGAPEAQAAGPTKAAAAAPAAAPAATLEDPMDRLRQRLAERLAGGRGDALGGKVELRPAATGRAAAKEGAKALAAALHTVSHGSGAQAPRKAAAEKPAARTATSIGAHGSVPHWGYEGAAGPAAWGGLEPGNALCSTGQRQSPIDIRDGLAVDLDPVAFDYQASRFSVIDNGHTVQVNVAPGSWIDVGGRRYELVQFHFHRPSEERIDGRQFEMSVHLVHKDAQGRLAVVGLLLEKGPAQPVVQTVWNNLPLEQNVEAPARATIDPAALLPVDRRYYTYMGSLTTPPCSEGVQWVVMRTPVSVAAEQVELFSRIYPMNARPVQSAAGRRILQSN